MREIRLPASEEAMRALQVGDEVEITGVMITARDAAHKYLVEEPADEMRDLLRGSMIYHCGPVVKEENGDYSFVAAGPTTSIREEPYEAAVIEKFGVRGIIGKGGMGKKTLEACRAHGCVYLHAIGGLAVILAQSVKKVAGVHKLEEFGTPEAMWVIEVEKFPAVVTMDAHGHSLHEEIEAASKEQMEKLI